MLTRLSALAMSSAVFAHGSHDHSHDHDHSHAEPEKTVATGYFDDAQVQARELSDWEGAWQSVYPYLMDGTLDPVMEHKAEHGDMTAEEYRAYYETGYRTNVDHITIDGDRVAFTEGDRTVTGTYADDGYEVLTYAKGNRGVRYVFRKTEGDSEAPDYIQFSDHIIAPEVSHHYHLYWGNDREALLDEVVNWPTYYPADLDAAGIADEMLAH